MAGQEENIKFKIGADASAFSSVLKSAMGDWDKFMGGFIKAHPMMLAFGAGAVAAGVAVIGMAKKTADTADALLKMSEETGVSVEKLSLLKFAAEQSDTSMESLSKGMEGLSRAVVGASRGLQTYTQVFDALGIKTKDSTGNTRDMMAIMGDVADAFSEMENGATKTGIAVQLGGAAFKDLIPFLNQGRDGIEDWTEQARIMGLTISTETAKASSDFNDQLVQMKRNFTALTQTIGAEVIPAFSNFLHFANMTITNLRKGSITFLGESPEILSAIKKHEAGIRETFEATRLAGKETDNLTEAEKRLTEEQKASREERMRKINDLLATKKTAKEIADAEREAAAERKAGLAEEAKGLDIVQEALELQLWKKEQMAQFDADYFKLYALLLKTQGDDIETINLKIAKVVRDRAKDTTESTTEESEKQKKIQATFQAWQEAAAQSVATSIKNIWEKQSSDSREVWKDAASSFIDTTAQMAVEAEFNFKEIDFAAAATTGALTLFADVAGSIFGALGGGVSSGTSEGKLASSLKAFLSSIEDTLGEFEKSVSTTFQNAQAAALGISDGLYAIQELADELNREVLVGLQTGEIYSQIDLTASHVATVRGMIIDNLDDMKDGIIERYRLEEDLIFGIMGLLDNQAAFVKDLDANITDVQRALLSPEELFQATLGDIEKLKVAAATATGEDQVAALADLQKAYNDLFSQAQNIYAEDPESVAQWQEFVLNGLEGVKDSGIMAYDEMIDVALEDLGVGKRQLIELQASNNLAEDLQGVLVEMQDITRDSLETLREIAKTEDAEVLKELVATLQATLDQWGVDIPQMAMGGITTQPTMAMLHANEAVIPLSQLAGMGTGGGTTTIDLHFNGPVLPGIKTLDQFSIPEAERLVKDVLFKAVENLANTGHTWPMSVSADA